MQGAWKVAFERARRKFVSVFAQRCVYLFAALLLLLVMVPFLEDSAWGRLSLNAVNIAILFSAAVAVSDSRICFALAMILGGATVACQILAFGQWEPQLLLLSRALGATFYFLTVSYLLAYVLRREVLTLDKLYGAASAFLMLGIIWAYFYAIVLYFHPGALAAGGTPIDTSKTSEMLYFSFTVLTSTGFGDITPVHPVARMLSVLEQVVGVLFVAILIARLAGTYPPVDRR
jgi:hypothetical protein